MRDRSLITFAVVAILLLSAFQSVSADGPDPTPTWKVCHRCAEDVILGPSDRVAHVLIFSDRLCGECVVVEEEVLSPLERTHGGQLVIDQRDVEGSVRNYNFLRALEDEYGIPHAAMPVLFIGSHALSGEDEIRERLPGLVEHYLALGGASRPGTPATPTPPPPPDVYAPPLHLAYVYQPGCQACDRLRLELDHLERRYPQLEVDGINVWEEEELAEWLGQRAGVPVSKRLTAPAVFVAEEALVGGSLTVPALEDLIARHVATGAPAVWREVEHAPSTAPSQSEVASTILARFRSFSLATVLLAGLIDGLNPCAFATLVFFVSYLTATGRRGRDVLIVGSAFALGVFVTYLGIGLGALEVLARLSFLGIASRWIHGLTAALCLLLALGSLHDWWHAHRGQAKTMRLRLPARLRRWVNWTIRRGMDVGAFVPVSFLTGAAVSVIELACTGQVYLPTILFVLGLPEMKLQAGLYLVLYNLMFVAPLVLVFVLATLGTTSQQLALLVHRHTAKVKLSTAALFLALAGWMVVWLF